MNDTRHAPRDTTAESSRCDRCGAPATFFACECSCDDAQGACTTSSNAYCRACAKALGVHPGVAARLIAWSFYLALRPFRGYLRRKYPPDYWRARAGNMQREWQ